MFVCVVIDPVWASVNLGIMLCINCSGEYLALFHCIYVCILYFDLYFTVSLKPRIVLYCRQNFVTFVDEVSMPYRSTSVNGNAHIQGTINGA